jgi:hypothetical protein
MRQFARNVIPEHITRPNNPIRPILTAPVKDAVASQDAPKRQALPTALPATLAQRYRQP